MLCFEFPFDQANGTDWIHVAMVYDGQEISLFVDGDEKASVQASGSIQAVPTPLLIGSMYNTSFFAGLMDQVMNESIDGGLLL